MNSPSNLHPLMAFLGAIIITLAGIAREVGIDFSLSSAWKGILYLTIIFAVTLIAIAMMLQLWRRRRR